MVASKRFLVSSILVTLCLALCPAPAHPVALAASKDASDLEAARKVFERNLDAIRKRDRDAYLACYLDAATLARTGPEGPRLGFEGLAKEAGTGWPDVFVGSDLQLVPVRPGIVYGTYRYRVRYGVEEHSGLSERLFVTTPSGFKIAVTTAFETPPGTPPPPRALVGATLVDGTGAPAVADSVVILRGGKIDCAGTRAQCPLPAGLDVMDVSGLWITPGLVDAHVHFSQTGWADGRPDALDVRDRYPYEEVEADLRARPERWFRSYLCSGVTSVFDVGGYPWTWELRERAERDPLAPRVRAAGPLLSTLDHWVNLPAERQFLYLADQDAVRNGVRYLKAHHADAAKVWFIPVAERDFDAMSAMVEVAGAEARRAGLRLIVHATGLREAKVALRAGAKLLVHSVWDKPVDEEFLRLARDNGTIYCPTLIVIHGYRRLMDAVATGQPLQVDDPGACVDAETLARLAETPGLGAARVDAEARERRRARAEETPAIMAGNLKRLQQAGIPIAMGTDAGNPLTLHGVSVHAEMEAMQAAGLTPMEVLVAATRGGALAMGEAERVGTVERGKAADLLVLGGDPTADAANFRKLRFVVHRGVVRAQVELRAPAR